MSHGHGPSRSLAASLLLNRCFFLQEQTASDFLSQSQLSIEPLISGMLGGCPISKAYLEAMLYGKYACFLGELKVRIRIRRDSEVEMKVQVQVVMCHVTHESFFHVRLSLGWVRLSIGMVSHAACDLRKYDTIWHTAYGMYIACICTLYTVHIFGVLLALVIAQSRPC